MDKPMTMPEALSLFRRLPTRMSVGVVAEAAQLAALEGVLPEQFVPIFRKISAMPMDPLPSGELTAVDVLVVEVDPLMPSSINRVHQALSRQPGLPLIAAVRDLDVDTIRTLMRVGCRDVVALPFNASELLPAIIDLSSQLPKSNVALAPMTSVIHAAGGAGASTIISHLAAAIVDAGSEVRCCVVDLDLQFGELHTLFGVSPAVGILDCIDAGERLDMDIIRNAATEVRPGIDLLASPRDVPPPEKLDVDQLLLVLETLRCNYDHVLIDFPAGWTTAGLSAACTSTNLLVVVEQTVRSISRASKTLSLLESVDVAAKDVALVVNRAEKRLFQPIDASDVGNTLRRQILGTIPFVKSGLQEAQDRGLLLSEQDRRGAFAKAFDQLALHLLAPSEGAL